MWWADTINDAEPEPLKVKNKHGERFALNVYNAPEHFRSFKYAAQAGMGAAMAFAEPEFVRFAIKNICGTPDKPLVRGGDNIGFAAGMALRHSGALAAFS